jgi:hypothetical protein
MRAEFLFERIELLLRRQISEQQQVNDFFETRVRRQIVDIVSTVG